ncbi:hypothetical protein [Bradyrhizobium sp. CB2312]|uniref:hypothetical protein n=1 Tax=Bradyrhizobium sp. CB2312 TaxID=3039155 RepID=UPI0024B159E6|nr:hypothetical protein [Bradyrhizobium sp. CB2312]WFU71220.1 hypothetical protein QA642_39295 [Bradyrhizobium sp. CB2312]
MRDLGSRAIVVVGWAEFPERRLSTFRAERRAATVNDKFLEPKPAMGARYCVEHLPPCLKLEVTWRWYEAEDTRFWGAKKNGPFHKNRKYEVIRRREHLQLVDHGLASLLEIDYATLSAWQPGTP